MTRDEVFKMARECGIAPEKDTPCRYEGWEEPMLKFAALVAAHEREECAQIADECRMTIIAEAIRSRGNA